MNEPIIPIPNPRIKNITGQRFGRLVALGYTGSSVPEGKALWLCQCECGSQVVVSGKQLRTNRTRSCGCLHREATGNMSRSHGMTETRIYSIWCNMRVRCQNTNTPQFKNHGGRGISVCDRWQCFENFYADMGDPPSNIHTIDRIDNDGNYCPDNCRWATPKEQSCNTRANHVVDYDGKSMNISQWAEYLGISGHVIHSRIRRGWTIERSLSTPLRVWPSKK